MAEKVHRSFRLDEQLAAGIDAYAEREGVSRNEAAGQLLAQALASNEHTSEHTDEHNMSTGEADEHEPGTGDNEEVSTTLDILTSCIGDLRGEVETLKGQLQAKDKQIESLSSICSQAQALHAIDSQKQLATTRSGIFSRIRAYLRGSGNE